MPGFRAVFLFGSALTVTVLANGCTYQTTSILVNDAGFVEDAVSPTTPNGGQDASTGLDGWTPSTDGDAGADGAEGADGGVHDDASSPDGALGSDSGGGDVCTPPSTVTYTKRWLAPHPHQAACSQANIDLFRQVCLGAQSDGGAACKSFTASAAGKPCAECILPTTGTQLGALIPSGGFVSPNLAGCIAITQNTVADGAGCASSVLFGEECRTAACKACAAAGNSTSNDVNACEDAADRGGCNAEATAETSCLNDAADGSASVCLASGFDEAYNAIARVFCLQ